MADSDKKTEAVVEKGRNATRFEKFSLTRNERRFEGGLFAVLYIISVVSGVVYIKDSPKEERFAAIFAVLLLLLSLAAIFAIYRDYKRQKTSILRANGIEPYRQEIASEGAKGISFKT